MVQVEAGISEQRIHLALQLADQRLNPTTLYAPLPHACPYRTEWFDLVLAGS
jgi:hypothetical protein